MAEKKKSSFWDKPEWYSKWRNSRACQALFVLGWILLTARYAYRGNWAEAHALATPFFIIALAYLIDRLCNTARRRSVSCLSLLIATPIAGLIGYLIFGSELLRSGRPTHNNPFGITAGLTLAAASVVTAAWLLIMLIRHISGPAKASTPRSSR